MNQFLPNSKFLNPFLAIVILSIGGMGFLPSPAQAQNRRPTFFEESQDPGQENRGFGNTFLNDALGGIADPLSRTGGVSTTVDSLQKVGFNGENAAGQLRSGQQILSPSSDRTNVIIPSSFDRTNVIIPSQNRR